MGRCNAKVETFSRVVGYYRPINRWNEGKQEEWIERKTFDSGINQLQHLNIRSPT